MALLKQIIKTLAFLTLEKSGYGPSVKTMPLTVPEHRTPTRTVSRHFLSKKRIWDHFISNSVHGWIIPDLSLTQKTKLFRGEKFGTGALQLLPVLPMLFMISAGAFTREPVSSIRSAHPHRKSYFHKALILPLILLRLEIPTLIPREAWAKKSILDIVK